MKKSLSRLFAVILAIVVVASAAFSVSAVAPAESYTYWTNVGTQRKAVYSKSMYDVGEIIDVTKLGVDSLKQITSMCKDSDNNLYILDSKSRIIILDDEYNLVREIKEITKNDGTTVTYDDAKGIYYNKGVIYVCNTMKGNVLMITPEGTLIDTITLPESNLIPEDFAFKPSKIACDSNGYIYILSEGSFYGALLYAPDRTFLGFFGSNTVKATISSVFTNISNRLFPNAEKYENSTKAVPYSFVDILVDEDDFVYTSNGYISASTADKQGSIRKLTPGYGNNILDEKVIFSDQKHLWGLTDYAKHDLCDIEVDSNGFIYALESRYDKVFLYDDDCKLLTVFGGGMGTGNQKGSFVNACAMVIKNDGDEVLIADYTTNCITVFDINAYGKQVKELDALTLEGHYDLVKEGWQDVLKQDANSQIAYSGLANAYLEEEDYDNALYYAKLGYDKKTYGVAFEYVRKDFVSENFTLIFIVIVVVVIGAIALMFITNKKKVVFIKNASLNLMLTTPLHPSNNFADIKEKGLGSTTLCFVLLILYYVVTIMKTLAGGFLFSNYDPASFNSIVIFIRSVGLVVLWIAANWLVCTLLAGKGKLKEILIVTCYSLQPLILAGVIHIILSNVLLPVEGSFLGILSTIAVIYFGFMLVMGMLKIHDYSMGKFLWTTFLTVIGMAIIVFLLIMLIILVQQFGAFVLTIITELTTI